MIGRWQNRYDDARAAIAAEKQILMFIPEEMARQVLGLFESFPCETGKK